MTDQPVSGYVAWATVAYANGLTIRQFATTTDAFVQASISWQIENDAVPGTFSVIYSVSAAAYVLESFSNTFSVVIFLIYHKNLGYHLNSGYHLNFSIGLHTDYHLIFLHGRSMYAPEVGK